MNIVLGVDAKCELESPSEATRLLRRLHFSHAAIDVASIVTPVYGDWGIDTIVSAEVYDVVVDAARNNANEAVRHTASLLRSGSSAVPEEVDCGIVRTHCPTAPSATEGILQLADRVKADLIAVDGPHQGPLGAFLTGSVARSLVIAAIHHSLLLAKTPTGSAGRRAPTPKDDDETTGPADIRDRPLSDAPLRVVFATDHSRYADRCLDKLIAMAPLGISHLTVLTAYPEAELAQVGKWLPDLAVHPETAMRQALTERNEAVLGKLSQLLADNAATSASAVIGAPVNEAISREMNDTNADLLILGATGHGFIDRLTMGSVSFQQAMTAPYSLLILRP